MLRPDFSCQGIEHRPVELSWVNRNCYSKGVKDDRCVVLMLAATLSAEFFKISFYFSTLLYTHYAPMTFYNAAAGAKVPRKPNETDTPYRHASHSCHQTDH